MKKDPVVKTIKRAVDASFWCKSKGGDMFVTWSPHVSLLSIMVYLKGWKEGTEFDMRTNIFFGIGDDCDVVLDDFIKQVEVCYGK
jgi:hypothetical protein